MWFERFPFFLNIVLLVYSGMEVCEPYKELTNGKISKNFVLAHANL